jgi:hypothetical protein
MATIEPTKRGPDGKPARDTKWQARYRDPNGRQRKQMFTRKADAEDIPDETHLVRHYAKEIVDRREALATKRANIVLRKWAHGQTPLDWCLAGPLPIKANGVRIRLDAATPDDIEDAARELEAAGKATFDEVMLLAACMRDLARGARRSNLPTVVLLGNLGPRHDHDGIITPDDLDDDSPF